MNITQVIVKKPSSSYVNGLTTASLGKADFPRALEQHDKYVAALKTAGVKVKESAAEEAYPDAVFVEDPAIVTNSFAVITRPGADSRKGETTAIEKVLKEFHERIYYIEAPGTLEGGDVLQAENHFYIGLSTRTNREGAEQLQEILKQEGYTASLVEVKEFFHLKTGISYLGEGRVLAAGEFIDHPAFQEYEQITVLPEEEYAANCVRINDEVLIPAGFSDTRKKIEAAGYQVIPLEMSEFQKQDGGLSCLSLRF
ncbi:dimethylarginine dimethylaminohydrolase family protein [Alkalicoccus daliensis]|uniref:Dimethylargininase n=1 Tax=Alkalicoccus daliensis TaxID=745820 RepID=A0A1H0G7B1_9BACI|nr:arginine deiminase family protein [Alkalicoccus daliensis]SDO02793.1 dimethylargininase [Alkalicoccus daliensis]